MFKYTHGIPIFSKQSSPCINAIDLLFYIHSCSVLKRWPQCISRGSEISAKSHKIDLKLLDINSGAGVYGAPSSGDPAGPLLGATRQKCNSAPAAADPAAASPF